MTRRNEDSVDIAIRKLHRSVGRIQDRQGSDGCYMELLRVARSAAELIRRHSYMFERPDRDIDGIRKSLWRLPQNQTWKEVQRRSNRIHMFATNTRKDQE